MFTPFKVRELSLKNRVIVSPMAVYMAEDGVPNDFSPCPHGLARDGRRCDGFHGDDVRLARRPNHAGVPRNVERCAA